VSYNAKHCGEGASPSHPWRTPQARGRGAHATILLLTFIVSTYAIAQQPMQRFETKYYILYTDVPRDQALEAAVRMTKMAEEYHTRTRDFSGAVRFKFPFYLYLTREEYNNDGGREGTDGVFDGEKLRAFGGQKLNNRTWHVIQHEGFHQFAAAVIGGDRPVWINEGLAEYFGEALFTGDGFISGYIPAWRLKRVKEEIREKKFLPLDRMMKLSLEEWNAKIAVINYDQAWSMVHFLAHGENGKYQKALAAYMIDLSKNKPANRAWADNFGNPSGFEAKWQAWWMALAENPSADLDTQATVARLTSYLARGVSQKQTFNSFDEFRTAAQGGNLKMSQNDWLPAGMLSDALLDAEDLTKSGATWALVKNGSSQQIVCALADGRKVIGSYTLKNGLVVRADAKIEARTTNAKQAPPH
jgi:hypothetical protein